MNEVSVAVSPSPSANAPNGSPPTNPLYKPAVASGPRIEFPLPGDNSIQIQLKKPVSKKTFERIKQLVALSEESLVDEGQLGGQ